MCLNLWEHFWRAIFKHCFQKVTPLEVSYWNFIGKGVWNLPDEHFAKHIIKSQVSEAAAHHQLLSNLLYTRFMLHTTCSIILSHIYQYFIFPSCLNLPSEENTSEIASHSTWKIVESPVAVSGFLKFWLVRCIAPLFITEQSLGGGFRSRMWAKEGNFKAPERYDELHISGSRGVWWALEKILQERGRIFKARELLSLNGISNEVERQGTNSDVDSF